ncbi:NadS family protein [Xenorhabdus ishibashii]|uniref:Transcriptional regulator n=1 Tax=Xenorhabdus ishibashii TaxID=1034471 RepID=A0A2D0KHE3_9GAMM|nr:NadS family protein [Xenorhabdus ishibashii]PHM62846.1 transcriptional regulator [Xenorhabdus ishibashii]
MNFFDELKTSLEEAVEIKKGNKAAERVTRYEIADVKAIRAQLNISQAEMAKALGTSIDTIKSWEQKRRNPTGLAAKVLAIIQENPNFYKALTTIELPICHKY